MNTVIAQLKKRKEELGLTNKELSTLSGVPYGTVCRVLSKMDGTPNLQTLKDLAQALNVSIDGAIGLGTGQESAEQSGEQGAHTSSEDVAAEDSRADPKIIKTIISSYDALLEERQRMLDAKDMALASKEKWLVRLFITCCTLVGIIVGILIFDLVNPSIGFFQR